jgi:hypothetical protein
MLCMQRIGEGRHWSLIKLLILAKVDFTLRNDIALTNWPRAFEPNWICEGFVADPFFLEVLIMISDQCPGKSRNSTL